jgi:hypothetical protein
MFTCWQAFNLDVDYFCSCYNTIRNTKTLLLFSVSVNNGKEDGTCMNKKVHLIYNSISR